MRLEYLYKFEQNSKAYALFTLKYYYIKYIFIYYKHILNILYKYKCKTFLFHWQLKEWQATHYAHNSCHTKQYKTCTNKLSGSVSEAWPCHIKRIIKTVYFLKLYDKYTNVGRKSFKFVSLSQGYRKRYFILIFGFLKLIIGLLYVDNIIR